MRRCALSSSIRAEFWVITSRLVSISFENIWFWLSRSSLLYMENFRIATMENRSYTSSMENVFTGTLFDSEKHCRWLSLMNTRFMTIPFFFVSMKYMCPLTILSVDSSRCCKNRVSPFSMAGDRALERTVWIRSKFGISLSGMVSYISL